jgi:uncharacterized protein with FMN-binding domain
MLLKITEKSQFRTFLFCILPLVLATGCNNESTLYKPGEYRASSEGFRGPVTVSVTFSEGMITDVQVVSHTETIDETHVAEGAWGDVEEVVPHVIQALSDIPSSIVERQSLEVDTVSGATATSKAIIKAVEKCVKEARSD